MSHYTRSLYLTSIYSTTCICHSIAGGPPDTDPRQHGVHHRADAQSGKSRDPRAARRVADAHPRRRAVGPVRTHHRGHPHRRARADPTVRRNATLRRGLSVPPRRRRMSVRRKRSGWDADASDAPTEGMVESVRGICCRPVSISSFRAQRRRPATTDRCDATTSQVPGRGLRRRPADRLSACMRSRDSVG